MGQCNGLLLDNDNPTLLDNPSLVIHYLSKENFERMESYHQSKHGPGNLTTDFSAVNFYLSTPDNFENPFKFNAKTDPRELLLHGFDISRETKIFVHGWMGDHMGYDPIVFG